MAFSHLRDAAIVVAISLISFSASAADPLTTNEMRALSAKEANQQIRDDLLSILQPTGRIKTGHSLTVGDVWTHTKAYATPYKGLCRRDTLSLYYAATDDREDYGKRPVRPYRITAWASYRFVQPPKHEYIEQARQDDYDWSVFDPECKKADDRPDDNEWYGWFEAESPEIAMEAALAVPVVHEWAKVDGHEFASCQKNNSFGCKSQGLQYLTLDNLGGVARCKAPAGELCYVIGKYADSYTIKARATNEPMKPEDIISVDYEIMIVVT